MNVTQLIIPELTLLAAAALLFLMGGSNAPKTRLLAPVVALLAMVGALVASLIGQRTGVRMDDTGSLAVTALSVYIKSISIGVGALFVLLAWPTSRDGASNRSISFSTETSEYFALLLLAITGMCVVASANSLPTLFLGIELASIPTYIMVTMSRPHQQAQEAGVKYFFLGALSAAMMLLGMSYLFGVTGEMRLDHIIDVLRRPADGPGIGGSLLMLAVLLMMMSFLFKLAAVPLHFYAGDVYQGAATPVTAAISFIPKIAGMTALIKLLYVAGAGTWALDPKLMKLVWIIAVLTMTVGNVLGLLQYNVKRVLAYSSIAHSGYLLVGLATLVHVKAPEQRGDALAAIAFYMLAYGVMNVAVFGVLMLLPAKVPAPARTAETYDDLAGAGWRHPVLGVVMALGCFSLIGIPATAGFFGKLYLLKPAIQSGNTALVWLAVLTMINAAISAGYYLKIVTAMWSKSDGAGTEAIRDTAHDSAYDLGHQAPATERSVPVLAAIALSAAGILAAGIVFPLTGAIYRAAASATAWLADGPR
ncbi:MAG: NADH-quinone oxidoreductase subunit N [Burkholderiales bacterium]|nr:NADH-quinone oxidoreductase subunit N [Phycisphaerae bacterium]